jgi:hypothetical protein
VILKKTSVCLLQGAVQGYVAAKKEFIKKCKNYKKKFQLTFQVSCDVRLVVAVTVPDSMNGQIASFFRDKPNSAERPHPTRLESSATLR